MTAGRWRLALLAAVLASASGCLAGGRGWTELRSANFVVRSNAWDKSSESTLEWLEYANAAYRSSFFRSVPRRPRDVVVLRDPDFGALFGYRRRFVVIDRLPGDGPGRDGLIVVHEDRTVEAQPALALALTRQTLPKSPAWFQLGMADFLSSVKYLEDPSGLVLGCFGRNERLVLPMASTDELLREESFFAADNTDWAMRLGGAIVTVALFRRGLLMRDPPLDRLVRAFAAGESSERAIGDAFGVGPDQLQGYVQQRLTELPEDRRLGPCPMAVVVPPSLHADASRLRTDWSPAAGDAFMTRLAAVARPDDGTDVLFEGGTAADPAVTRRPQTPSPSLLVDKSRVGE